MGDKNYTDNTVLRCFVEKKPGFNVAANTVKAEISDILGVCVSDVRMFNRYDVQNLPRDQWRLVMGSVLSEPMCDDYYESLPFFSEDAKLLCIEPLPGQYDARADSCSQCIQMLLGGERPLVATARVFALYGLGADDFERVKGYLINPLEYRETLPDAHGVFFGRGTAWRPSADVPVIAGFTAADGESAAHEEVAGRSATHEEAAGRSATHEEAAGESADEGSAVEEIVDDNLPAGESEDGGLIGRLGLAMSPADLEMIRAYFRGKGRDPSLAELRVIDTYWSDHCRHSTFNTIITSAEIHDKRVKDAYDLYMSLEGGKPVTLMRIATAAMRHLRGRGGLPMLDVSDENNACTVRVNAAFDNRREDWLLFFKNETHNHPTEIEPYGGASTCLGGAIRDPLSGRAYVYQAMRITGAGDPRKPINSALPGKIPQRKLTVTAAEGFSSYGNQIGLATGYVKELYHEGYVAKRLEAGAVVGAAPRTTVRREAPAPGDAVVLLGGRTGRDGIGGATGSSKIHGMGTVSESASEVQKGNAPEERKLQRLFRNPRATALIKRCNDFGAGGASVAIGELAEGVEIDLDAMPVKYDGLEGAELALSESQERLAAVVAWSDAKALMALAEAENIEATVVARVTNAKRLVMKWRGKIIVNIDRGFLDTNGARRYAAAYVPEARAAASTECGLKHWQEQEPAQKQWHEQENKYKPAREQRQEQEQGCKQERSQADGHLADRLLRLVGDLNFCSQKGLATRFDSSIGAGSVFAPYGGEHALTETQAMAALLPGQGAKTASVMAYGFDPHYTEADPFGGSAHAVVTSAVKLIAAGADPGTIHFSLQEYFPSPGTDAARWGLPLSALLGAFDAQMGLGMAAIGGKDSMSGSFGGMDVPPTLISFAVGTGDAHQLISPEFKGAGHPVYLLEAPMRACGLPDYGAIRAMWESFSKLCRSGSVLSAWVCEVGGVYGGIIKMAMGNMIGYSGLADDSFFDRRWGSIIIESATALEGSSLPGQTMALLGYTQAAPALRFGADSMPLVRLREAWEAPLEGVFPIKAEQRGDAPDIMGNAPAAPFPYIRTDSAKPKAVIPVFPGTNCEYDTASAIERAGGAAEMVLVRNLTPALLQSSIIDLSRAIATAQMILFPGGFSGGDEPDGAGKFIVSLFRNPRLTDAVRTLFQDGGGLILGICNGFQALVKLGLLPGGDIAPTGPDSPTLTFNAIGRHQSMFVKTKVAAGTSPWLSKCTPGEIYVQPVSHGEGRFAAGAAVLSALRDSGQIVSQYVDGSGAPSMDIAYNPSGSVWAIEGICSPDGRILGKMAHPERHGEYIAKNIPGNKYLPIFDGGVSYFK
ncbi:MAG: phosphoribosylformylglycinamidine synthase subunit PurQ [Oscillospiraceae bacterium]|nr:phosphoribosylformylglycinamidine synthase subunit PurQ [Oscillospiraceae bacterium]